MNLDQRLTGRAVFITGGGSGIGKGAGERIAAEGGMVALADVRPRLAEEAAAAIRAAGGQAIALECDVADEESVARAIAAAVQEFGGLYGLFANAGTAGLGWLHEMPAEDWRFVLGVNLDGVFFSCKHALPHMMESGGSIVATSSIAGSVAGAGGSAVSYTVSKFGVIGMMRQIAVDYGGYGIRANAIQPAGVEGSNLAKHAAEDRERWRSMASADPMRRPKPWLPIRRQGRARDEYGATVAFLMSDDAGYITGTQIPVDGGYLST